MASWGRVLPVEIDGLHFYLDERLRAAGILAAFTTRVGGSSRPPFDSLNLAFHEGDAPRAVVGNRERVASALEIDVTALTFADQVHGAVVTRIVPGMKGAGAVAAADALPSTDALFTTEANTYLTILTADCLPIILADPDRRIVSVVHAGWRGTFDRIAKNAVEAMVGAGARPAAIQARLGPHIAGDCYEVGEALHKQFAKRFSLPGVVNGFYLDLAALNADVLMEAGVSAENIETIDVCTHCRGDLLYSWRRDGITGRQAALTAILQT